MSPANCDHHKINGLTPPQLGYSACLSLDESATYEGYDGTILQESLFLVRVVLI